MYRSKCPSEEGVGICVCIFFLLQTEGQEKRIDETSVFKLNGKMLHGWFHILIYIFYILLLFILFYFAVAL